MDGSIKLIVEIKTKISFLAKSARQSSQQLAAFELASQGVPTSVRYATGHQPFLQLVLTCLAELDTLEDKKESGKKNNR